MFPTYFGLTGFTVYYYRIVLAKKVLAVGGENKH